MDVLELGTAADPDDLVAQLPADPPAGWQRTDSGGGIVQYRLPVEDSPCTAGSVTVRPDVLGEAAVRVDRTKGCQSAGTTYHDSAESAAEVVAELLDAAPAQ